MIEAKTTKNVKIICPKFKMKIIVFVLIYCLKTVFFSIKFYKLKVTNKDI